MLDHRISIFVGHFGSGKSEVAVNCAMHIRQTGHPTTIVDLDIVNPFFRTADVKRSLQEKEISVILPQNANTGSDAPELPAEIISVFQNKAQKVVMDVGGDDLGAVVLSRYREEIMEDDAEIFFVINTRRPMTDSVRKIIEMVGMVESSSRIKVSCLVNNTNILAATRPDIILEGYRLVSEAAERLQIPVAFTSGLPEALEMVKTYCKDKVFPLQKYIMLPWEENCD